jgi:antibiotic biosynthesis monooxygenase (ABM) superfamily enzyme
MAQSDRMDDTPIALVTQHRVAEASYAAYTRWLARLTERLRRQPGFVADEIIAPSPPVQLDWIIVARFANAQAARQWLGLKAPSARPRSPKSSGLISSQTRRCI